MYKELQNSNIYRLVHSLEIVNFGNSTKQLTINKFKTTNGQNFKYFESYFKMRSDYFFFPKRKWQ